MDSYSQAKDYMSCCNYDAVRDMVENSHDHHALDSILQALFNQPESQADLIEQALEAIMSVHRELDHGSWVHSVSHFTENLWQRRMDSWIKRINELTFRHASEDDCSNRLVNNFALFANFDDDPADFHLLSGNLTWMDWEYYGYAKARIEVGRFDSKADFLRWQLSRPERRTAFNYEAQIRLVDSKFIRSLINQLKDLGEDVSEFDGLERDLHVQKLIELERERNMLDGWKRERVEKGIEITKAIVRELS